jgi:hypothetical protein
MLVPKHLRGNLGPLRSVHSYPDPLVPAAIAAFLLPSAGSAKHPLGDPFRARPHIPRERRVGLIPDRVWISYAV